MRKSKYSLFWSCSTVCCREVNLCPSLLWNSACQRCSFLSRSCHWPPVSSLNQLQNFLQLFLFRTTYFSSLCCLAPSFSFFFSCVALKLNTKWDIFHKRVKWLSLNIWWVLRVSLWIKYGFVSHCIRLVFTLYSMFRLFWKNLPLWFLFISSCNYKAKALNR